MSAQDGGPWTDADHEAYPGFDAALAQVLESSLRPPEGWRGHRVIDWGGGMGYYLDVFAEAGAETILVEPLVVVGVSEAHKHIRVGFDTTPFHWASPPAPHLTLCIEVMEHIVRQSHADAFDNICASVPPGGYMVFSGATPGQGGIGHVAERTETEWMAELDARGLKPQFHASLQLRDAATLPWLKKNIMLWKRPDNG